MDRQKFERKMRKHVAKLHDLLEDIAEASSSAAAVANDTSDAAHTVLKIQSIFERFVASNPASIEPPIIPESLRKPVTFLVGQRVIADNEIGTVCTPARGYVAREGFIWVRLARHNHPAIVEFAAHKVSPLPNGQL